MKAGLGRGLNALLDASTQQDEKYENIKTTPTGVQMVDIRKIEPNKDQPRKYFDEAALAELAASMKEYGVISPLVVKDEGTFYSIIAGERRYRAARLAKLKDVPVIVKDYSEMDILQVALIENIQRQDLTPIEEAQCYKRLMEDFFYSADDIAGKVGKNKHAVIGMLHLLELDPRAQALAAEGKLSPSHAKLLLSVEDGDLQLACAERIVNEGLSVRVTETMVDTALKDANKPDKTNNAPTMMSDEVVQAFRRAEDELKRVLGSKVVIKPGKKKGRIEIEYYSPDELERLLKVIGGVKSE